MNEAKSSMPRVYAITKKGRGPAGHGEPGFPYLALATDGEWFDLGNPLPVFATAEAAEARRKEVDRYGYYEVTPLDVAA